MHLLPRGLAIKANYQKDFGISSWSGLQGRSLEGPLVVGDSQASGHTFGPKDSMKFEAAVLPVKPAFAAEEAETWNRGCFLVSVGSAVRIKDGLPEMEVWEFVALVRYVELKLTCGYFVGSATKRNLETSSS